MGIQASLLWLFAQQQATFMASTAAIGGTGADVAPPTGSNNASSQIAARLAGVMKGTPALLRSFSFF